MALKGHALGYKGPHPAWNMVGLFPSGNEMKSCRPRNQPHLEQTKHLKVRRHQFATGHAERCKDEEAYFDNPSAYILSLSMLNWRRVEA